MATATQPTIASGLPIKTSVKALDPVKIDVTRLPTDEEPENAGLSPDDSSRTTLHIYFEHPGQHKNITPMVSPAQERRFGPTPKQQKERRTAKKAERKIRERSQTFPSLTPSATPAAPASPETPIQELQHAEPVYYLHKPFLSFHTPPSVLYTTNPTPSPSRHSPAKPVALIHSACFWRTYTLQLGLGIALPGVIDARGVVSWAHDCSKREREADEKALRGYKVRGWRLCGETGKAYVHAIRSLRKSGVEFVDPDKQDGEEKKQKVMASEVVTLCWTRPLSRATRMYGFVFQGVVFKWKGTSTVREPRRCGWMLRYCHLKLVAVVPSPSSKRVDAEGEKEVCLATYRSSSAAEKNGTLEIFDRVVLGFVEEWMPSLLGEGYNGGGGKTRRGGIEKLKTSVLYQVIVATVLCVASAEKEKRHTLIDLIIGIAENGGNGGG